MPDPEVARTPQGAFADCARADARAALVTAVAGEHIGARLFVGAGGDTLGTLGDAELDTAARAHADELMWVERPERRGDLLIDITAPPPRLVAFGAVSYADYLSTIAKVLGWHCYVVDPRARFATRERFPQAHEVVVGWPEAAFEQIGAIDRQTYIVMLTHDPKLDDAALLLALRSEPAYIGAMGSRRAQKERRERLTAEGITDEELQRISAPVGLDLGAVSAAETALSIMSEVIAVRYGRSGGRLSENKGGGRIHKALDEVKA